MAVGKTGFSAAMFTRNVDLRIIANAVVDDAHTDLFIRVGCHRV
jgi:hypothetical protein